MTNRITLPNDREETFGMYWMGDAPYDAASLFESLSTLFASMASFNDNGAFCKILIRRSTFIPMVVLHLHAPSCMSTSLGLNPLSPTKYSAWHTRWYTTGLA